jgi:hypothetical protein
MTTFAPNASTACLYSTLRNMSSVGRAEGRFFGFLPPHGRRLQPCEEITVPGDMMSWFKRQTEHGRARRSFESALANGDLALVSSPSVHLFDATLDLTRILALDNNTLITVDPCWGSYSSSSCPAD